MRKTLVFLFVSITLFGQSKNLYVPRNIEDAYFFQTRSYDGKPGDKYWINSADYKIDVEVKPNTRELLGKEIITYFNNSPDDLSKIVIRLYQDFYRKGTSRDWDIDSLAVNNGVIISSLKLNGKEITSGPKNGQYERYGTNLTIKLEDFIKSGESVKVEAEWSFKIPFLSKVRMGMYDESTFFVSFWYPQIAVYDDIDGWDENHYKGTTEMYNDFNNYEVNISVPANSVVWATGLLQNPQEVLEEKYIKRLEEASGSDEIINIITEDDLISGDITKQNENNIWIYKADHVPDFSFAFSDHYLWDATSLEVEKNRRVLIDAAYNKKSKDFYEVASLARKAINYFSTELPGVPFPYPAMTVFNGSGGMEYPMMVNDGTTETRARTVSLTAHEISHTYFPFFMGTNERKYAWMDEGWAVFFPYGFQSKEEPGYDPRSRNMDALKNFSGEETEMPPMVPNIFLTGNSYRASVYARAGMAYDYLHDFLGDNIFKTALKEYIKRWNGKHPIPYDFFYTFNDVVGEDLSWFWKPWFFDPGYADLALDKVFTYEDSYEVYIKKVGALPVPIKLNITYTDGTTSKMYKNAEVWKNGNDEYIIKLSREKDIQYITLGDEHILDVDSINNEVMVER